MRVSASVARRVRGWTADPAARPHRASGGPGRKALHSFLGLLAFVALASPAIGQPRYDELAGESFATDVWIDGTRDGIAYSFYVDRPAYVAVFEVVPGYGARLVYPRLGYLGREVRGGTYSQEPFGPATLTGTGALSRADLAGGVRYLVLVASESPLRLERFSRHRISSYANVRYAYEQPSDLQLATELLLDSVLPLGTNRAWSVAHTTFVYKLSWAGNTYGAYDPWAYTVGYGRYDRFGRRKVRCDRLWGLSALRWRLSSFYRYGAFAYFYGTPYVLPLCFAYPGGYGYRFGHYGRWHYPVWHYPWRGFGWPSWPGRPPRTGAPQVLQPPPGNLEPVLPKSPVAGGDRGQPEGGRGVRSHFEPRVPRDRFGSESTAGAGPPGVGTAPTTPRDRGRFAPEDESGRGEGSSGEATPQAPPSPTPTPRRPGTVRFEAPPRAESALGSETRGRSRRAPVTSPSAEPAATQNARDVSASPRRGTPRGIPDDGSNAARERVRSRSTSGARPRSQPAERQRAPRARPSRSSQQPSRATPSSTARPARSAQPSRSAQPTRDPSARRPAQSGSRQAPSAKPAPSRAKSAPSRARPAPSRAKPAPSRARPAPSRARPAPKSAPKSSSSKRAPARRQPAKSPSESS